MSSIDEGQWHESFHTDSSQDEIIMHLQAWHDVNGFAQPQPFKLHFDLHEAHGWGSHATVTDPRDQVTDARFRGTLERLLRAAEDLAIVTRNMLEFYEAKEHERLEK